jgi:Acyl-CoA reductase (LuxC)
MALATTSATTVVDIPFLIRGKVVQPGDDDAVEFGGRVGARFRTPDPARWANQLTLANGTDLRDLHELKVDEIIDFLVDVGPRLTLEENPLVEAAFRLALDAGELTESVLRPVYDAFPYQFSRDRLDLMVEKTIGKAYLDGWVERGAPGQSYMRTRAIGTRQLHIIAGNVPVTAAITVARAALCKADCLIKMPSNDPFTAAAIVQSMIDLDPNHPVTKHFAVAYWKGGDEAVERQVIHPARIEKLTAWGGMASMVHIQKYLVPGIELIAMNPKLSISIVGHEALENDDTMKEAALGVAGMAGHMNQTACSSTRVVYVECGEDEDDLAQLERLGNAIHKAFGELPSDFSTPPKRPDPELDNELEAVALVDDYYRVIGDSSFGGVVVSRTVEEPVEFAQQLTNRIVNLVPVPEIHRVVRWVNEETQTVGIYPERLREQLRDDLALAGVQRTLPITQMEGTEPAGADPTQRQGIPHDGMEPMRRMVRWVLDCSRTLAG